MTPISNSDVLYLSRAKQIEIDYKGGDANKAYEECEDMLQDPNLPFYYRGRFHLILSEGNDDPVGHAILALEAFNQMLWQSPGDIEVANYVVYAQEFLEEANRRMEKSEEVEDDYQSGMGVDISTQDVGAGKDVIEMPNPNASETGPGNRLTSTASSGEELMPTAARNKRERKVLGKEGILVPNESTAVRKDCTHGKESVLHCGLEILDKCVGSD